MYIYIDLLHYGALCYQTQCFTCVDCVDDFFRYLPDFRCGEFYVCHCYPNCSQLIHLLTGKQFVMVVVLLAGKQFVLVVALLAGKQFVLVVVLLAGK